MGEPQTSDPHTNDTYIINLTVVSAPVVKCILKQLLLFGQGYFLNGQKQFLEPVDFQFLSTFTPELVNEPVSKQIKGVLLHQFDLLTGKHCLVPIKPNWLPVPFYIEQTEITGHHGAF